MPMEAGAIGIRPINQPQRTGSSDGVQRREDGGSGSGFRPQTSVAIKTAIDDMAGVLSKISTNEKLSMEKLPEEVSQVVKNILQQAFSMESTLSQGIGSTLESQRFSMEQLSVFARMLTQIGALAEKGFSMELSNQMELILKNLKSLVVNEEGGNTFEPVLLSKAAFELIDSKNAEQLPQQLYELLAALSEDNSSMNMNPSQLTQSDSMNFLKQLVKYFMPKPMTEDQNVPQEGQSQQLNQRQAAQSQARQFLQSMFGNLKSQQGQSQQLQSMNQNQPQQAFNNQQPQQMNQNQPQQAFNNNQQPQQMQQMNQNQLQQNVNNQQQPQQMQQMNQNQPQQAFNNQQQPQQMQQMNQNQPQQAFNNQQQPQQMQQMNQNQPQQAFNNQQQPQQMNQMNQNQPQQAFNNQQSQQMQQMNQNQPQQAFNNQQQPQQMNQMNQNQPQQAFNNNQQPQQMQQMNQNQPQQTFNNQQQPQQMNQNQPQQSFNNQQPQQMQQMNQNQPQQTFNNQQQPQQMNQNQPQQAFNNNQQQPQQMNQMNQNQPQQAFNNNQQPQQMNQNNQSQQTFNNQQPQSNQSFSNQQPQQMNQMNQNQPQQAFNNNQQPQQMQQMNQNNQSQQTFNNQQPQNMNQNNQNQPQQAFNNQQPQQMQQMNQNAPSQSQQSFGNSDLQAQQQLFSQKLQAQLDRLEQGDDFLAKQQQLKTDIQAAKTVLLKQPLQNTPQTMDAMRQLANLIVKNPDLNNLSERDTAALKDFVNNNQSQLSEGEARHLQNLLRLCQQNVPITVQQAAVQQKLPDLTRLWAFMQLCDMAPLTSKLSAKAFKRAGRDVAEFANAMRQSMGGDNSSVQNAAQNNRSLQMMMPLYVGDNDTSYPTYLHVYDENEKDKETGEEKKETWLRICVLTDYIGAVELTFRMYEGNQLDLRFYFSERSAASEFRNYIPSLKEKLKETTLNVGEVRIGSVGQKMMGEDS